MMNARWKIAIAAAAAISAGIVWVNALPAQQPGFTRVELQRIDVDAPGMEAVLMRADFAPNASVGKHTHPGEEVAYLLEGAIELSVEGKSPRTIKKGESFSLPKETVHWAKNV